MPIPIIAAILLWSAVTAVIVLVALNWKKVLAWFHAHQGLKQADKDHIAFTLQKKLATGDYKTIQGVFNKRTDAVLDGEVYQHKEMDQELAMAHAEKELVLYE